MKKRIIGSFFIISLMVYFTGCSNNLAKADDLTDLIDIDTNISTDIIKFDDNDYYEGMSENNTKINLNGNTANISGDGAIVSGNIVKINAGGEYVINGTLSDGSILVDVGEDEDVNIILNNVDIKCLTGAPIYVNRANKLILSLAEGSSNRLSDTANYSLDTEATATIYSKSDLTINGLGELTVNANYNNAIQSKDILNILGGTININSSDDGIIGKDMVQILNGNINIVSNGDGIKSTNDTDAVLGYVAIKGGDINITASSDGIQAQTSLIIDGGKFDITTGGGSGNESSSENYNWGKWGNQNTVSNEDTSSSAKGLKAKGSILITSGEFNINSSDDSIHSNNSIIIKNGTFEVSSGDDGIHADTAISIEGGNINISKSYEGIESASIVISGGEIKVVSLDDGINVAGGKDSSAVNGRPGQNNFSELDNSKKLYIKGGNIFVNASGDGIDVNGATYMSDGNVVVNGPTSGANSALDYDNVFEVTGGKLIAIGSAGMMQSISSSSTQCGVSITFPETKKAGLGFSIKDSNGNEIINIIPEKDYRSVVVSSSQLKIGESYKIYTDDTEYLEFTINNTLTNVSNGNLNDNTRPFDKNMEPRDFNQKPDDNNMKQRGGKNRTEEM